VVCLVAAGVGACGGRGTPEGAISGPARAATAGRGEACDRDAIASGIDAARLRGHLARLGVVRFELGGHSLDGGGRETDAAVPIMEERSDRVRVAVPGQGLQLLVWIDRADLSPVAMAEHRVSVAPGEPPPADGLGVTVLPGYPVDRDTRDGWVHVRGHGLFAFEGWIPDDTGELWEPVPVTDRPTSDVWIEGGSALIDDPGGTGRVLARLRRTIKAHLLESNALGADKIEVLDDDARLVGYAVRPPPMRRLGPELSDLRFDPSPGDSPTCLYSEPGGAIIGILDGPLVAVSAAREPGWALTPIATPWGDVVVALHRTVGPLAGAPVVR